MRKHGLLLFFTMFEKWTKKVASKATDGAVEGVKETLNDKIEQYGDIIKVGLVLSIIIIGGRHLAKPRTDPQSMTYSPRGMLPGGCGQPIVINNYYPYYEARRKERRYNHGKTNYRQQPSYTARKNYSKY